MISKHKILLVLLSCLLMSQQAYALSHNDDICNGLMNGEWRGVWRDKSLGCTWYGTAAASYIPNPYNRAHIEMTLSNGQPYGQCETGRSIVLDGNCYNGWLYLSDRDSGSKFQGSVDYLRMEIFPSNDRNYISKFMKDR